MSSDYEMSAKRAAVEAVEKRWQAREEAQAKAKRQRSFTSVAAVAAIVIIAALHCILMTALHIILGLLLSGMKPGYWKQKMNREGLILKKNELCRKYMLAKADSR